MIGSVKKKNKKNNPPSPLLISRVVEQKAVNMMSFENLAIVFAPTLMR